MIITGNNEEEINELKRRLFLEFEMKDLENLKYFFGTEVLRSKKEILDQALKIDKHLDAAKIQIQKHEIQIIWFRMHKNGITQKWSSAKQWWNDGDEEMMANEWICERRN